MSQRRWLLVDPGSLLHAAHRASPPRQRADGLPGAALAALAAYLLEALQNERPTWLLAAWDSADPSWRHQAYPDYGHEPEPPELVEQTERARELLAASGAVQITLPGYEARDVLASVVAQQSAVEVVLLGADRDLCALVGDRVALLTPRGSHLRRWDADAVHERYGVQPRQWAEWRALVGDESSGLPGVPGVGEKTAAQWLTRYGRLNDLLASRLPGQRGAALRAAAEQVQAVRAVTGLASDAPLAEPAGGWPRQQAEPVALARLLRGWGFGELARSISPARAGAGGAALYRAAAGSEAVARVLDELHGAGVVGLAADGQSMAVSPRRGEAWLLAANEAQPLVAALAAERARFVAHDLLAWPAWAKGALASAHGDTQLALWLLDPERAGEPLDEVGRRWLELRPGPGGDLPPDQDRLCRAADWSRRLEPLLGGELAQAGLEGTYRGTALAATVALAEMAARAAEAGQPGRLRRAANGSGRIETSGPLPGAPAGLEIWAIDLVDVVIWLLAELSGDQVLRRALRAAAPGSRAAEVIGALLFGVPATQLSAAQRQQASALGAAQARGGQARWLARRLRCQRAEAEALSSAFEQRFPAVPAWRADLARRGAASGWLRTLDGRRWRVAGQSPGQLAGQAVEAALGDLLTRALLACGEAAVWPRPLGWLVAWPAELAESKAAQLAQAWAQLLSGSLRLQVNVSPLEA